MDKEDRRGIFFGVVGVLTLIVAIIGASLAYFSISTGSDKDAITVQAASVKIVYDDGDQLNVEGIIPSTKKIAVETLRRALAGETHQVQDGPGQGQHDEPYKKCIDDKGYTVCGAYDFTLTNNGTNSVKLTGKVVPTQITAEENGGHEPIKFENLKYALFDISDDKTSGQAASNGETLVEEGSITYNEFNIFPEANVEIAGNGTVKKFRLFIWLNEEADANNKEQGAQFKGTVVIDVPNSQNITGTAESAG